LRLNRRSALSSVSLSPSLISATYFSPAFRCTRLNVSLHLRRINSLTLSSLGRHARNGGGEASRNLSLPPCELSSDPKMYGKAVSLPMTSEVIDWGSPGKLTALPYIRCAEMLAFKF